MKVKRNDFGIQSLTVIGDVVSVFLAYVLAMVTRYHILEAAPGINTLSLPYLLMAVLYSILISEFLQILRSSNKTYFRKYHNGFFNIVSLNGIGCLFFLAFLYIANVKYFSRWALLLFWIFSCLLLCAKNTGFNYLVKCLRKDINDRVIVIGDGNLAKAYALSVLSDPDCDSKIIGYLGDSKTEDVLLEEPGFANYGDGTDALHYLGRLSELECVLEKENISEIVIALEDISPEDVGKIIEIAEDRKTPVSLISIYERFLPSKPIVKTICGYNHMNAIELGKSVGETASALLSLLLSVVVSFLFIMLVIKQYGIGEFDNFRSFESYKVILCTLAGFAIYWKVYILRKNSAIKRLLFSFIVGGVALLFYEFIYCNGHLLSGFAVTDKYKASYELVSEPGTESYKAEVNYMLEDTMRWMEVGNELPGTVNESVRLIMKRKGITQEALAELLGVDRRMVYKLLSKENWSREHIVGVIIALKIPYMIASQLLSKASVVFQFNTSTAFSCESIYCISATNAYWGQQTMAMTCWMFDYLQSVSTGLDKRNGLR